jgi:hypothetical protein
MAQQETGGEKKSKREKTTAAPRLKKAVPPPDNPLLRHQADEVSLEGGNISQQEMARLRAKAWEQIQRNSASDSSDPDNKPPPHQDP